MAEAIESQLYNGKVKIRFFPESHQYWVDGKRKTGVTTYIGIIDKSKALIPWAVGLCEDFLVACLENGTTIGESHILDAVEQHNIRKTEAANLGTIVHDWCEGYIKHKLKAKGYEKIPDMPENQSAIVAITAFLDWEKEHKVKFLSSERVVFSKKYGYIGKMDIEAKIDGDLCLVDLKSSTGLYNTVRLQTAAYVKADEEESERSYKGRWAIRLAKETEEDYQSRMKKKQAKDVKKGREPREIPPYVAFEAMYLDENELNLEKDFRGFLNAKALFEWDKETDFYYNK